LHQRISDARLFVLGQTTAVTSFQRDQNPALAPLRRSLRHQPRRATIFNTPDPLRKIPGETPVSDATRAIAALPFFVAGIGATDPCRFTALATPHPSTGA
jgi:hypothetical protein